MLLTMMMLLVMERFLELAPFPVHASCMRLCLLVFIFKKRKNKKKKKLSLASPNCLAISINVQNV